MSHKQYTANEIIYGIFHAKRTMSEATELNMPDIREIARIDLRKWNQIGRRYFMSGQCKKEQQNAIRD